MDKMKGFMTKVRRRRLALFLVFALMLAIAPKVDILALGDSGDIAGRHVGDPEPTAATPTTTPTPTEDPVLRQKAEDFLAAVKDLVDNHKFAGRNGDTETFDQGLSNIKATYHPNVDTDLEKNSDVIKKARTLSVDETNSYVNAYLNILKLKKDAEDAVDKINTASAALPRSDSEYTNFKTKFEDAKEALKTYYDEYDYQEGLHLLKTCLSSDSGDVTQGDVIRNARIVNLTVYRETLEKEYRIEQEYKTVLQGMYKLPSGSYVFNGTSIELMEGLINILKEYGIDSTGTALIRVLYNGSEISSLLTDYKKVSNIIKPINAMTSAPTNEKELENLIRIKKLYDDLIKENPRYQDMIPRDVKEKLTTYSSSVTELNKIVDSIQKVTYPINDTEYKAFKLNYETAMAEYEGVRLRYNTSDSITGLIEGLSELLGDKTTVYNFLNRVHAILNTDDNQMCNHFTEMERIVNDYKSLSSLNQSRIYNYAAFNTVFENAKVAQSLRVRVDKLLLTLTADELDRQEVAKIRKDYSALNAKSKAYFGTLYANYIDELEYGNYAKSLELAARVDELIGRIGTINTNSGQKIADAENAYNALTDMQKALVKTYATLVAARKAYDLIKNDVSKAKVLGIAAGYVYTRKNITPSPRVFIDNKQLVAGTDYTLSYSKNKSVGTAKITITAVSGSGYFGTYTKSFKIVKDSISDGKVSNVKSSYKYTGKSIKPTPKLKVNGYTLKKGTDYTVTYSNNKKKGKATITLKGKGNYKGSKKKTFKIK